ncbi:hypothetical protein V7183_23710 [Bacillus sp. JJ1127]|uniref:hypothetical protein n=1 Tax=Bacillus sp. JJ1127 TaxID=3122952 RepID=UPI003000A3C9
MYILLFNYFLTDIFIDKLVELYISRIINDFFAGALYTAATASVIDMTTETNRNRYMGMVVACIGMFSNGPAIGGC